MILNLISSEAVVAKVISDLDISEDNLRISDMQEWIGEAIGKIGGMHEMGNSEKIIPIKNYQCLLPLGIKSIGQVAYSGGENQGWIPTIKSSGSFTDSSPVRFDTTDQTLIESDYVSIYMQMNANRNLSYQEAVEELEKNAPMKKTIESLAKQNNKTFGSGIAAFKIQYFVKPRHLVFNVKDGFAKIQVSEMPRDEYGYPLVPDIESYIEAIYWYIVTKMIYPRLLAGKIPMNIMEHAELQWHVYSNRAYGDVKSPNIDELISVANVWNRNFPYTEEEHGTFYGITSYPNQSPNR